MNADLSSKAPARRLGDEWVWIGFHSAAPSEHAGLELERLQVDELARLLLQAAEFRLRAALAAPSAAELSAEHPGVRNATLDARRATPGPQAWRSTLEFEAWRSAFEEQLAALRADGAALSPRLSELVGACLAAAGDVDAGARTSECAARGARSAPDRGAEDADRLEALLTQCGRVLQARERSTAARADSRGSQGCAARALASDGGGDSAAPPQAESALERWPAARELAQAARVLAPSARSHCALGRAHLAAGDVAAARGCFRAALASTADERIQLEAQHALERLGRTSALSSAVGAQAVDAPHSEISHV